ncbi:hypothetical protein [Holospora obtusa]|uniref:hypothetical protein n=1 Tax=Holospora obtusa TaxID=49893 RepID=UPI0009FE6FFE
MEKFWENMKRWIRQKIKFCRSLYLNSSAFNMRLRSSFLTQQHLFLLKNYSLSL